MRPFPALFHFAAVHHLNSMANRARTTGNVRPRGFESRGGAPPKKRFIEKAVRRSQPDVGALGGTSPGGASSTVSSDSGGAQKAYTDARGANEGRTEGGMSKENMQEMFEAWYCAECRVSPPAFLTVLGTTVAISTTGRKNSDGTMGEAEGGQIPEWMQTPEPLGGDSAMRTT